MKIREEYLDKWVQTTYSSKPIYLRFLDRRLYKIFSKLLPHIFEEE